MFKKAWELVSRPGLHATALDAFRLSWVCLCVRVWSRPDETRMACGSISFCPSRSRVSTIMIHENLGAQITSGKDQFGWSSYLKFFAVVIIK